MPTWTPLKAESSGREKLPIQKPGLGIPPVQPAPVGPQLSQCSRPRGCWLETALLSLPLAAVWQWDGAGARHCSVTSPTGFQQ